VWLSRDKYILRASAHFLGGTRLAHFPFHFLEIKRFNTSLVC